MRLKPFSGFYFLDEKQGTIAGWSCFIPQQILLSRFLAGHELSWWVCTSLWIKACHCGLLRTRLPVFAVELGCWTRPDRQKSLCRPSSLSSVFSRFVRWDEAPEVKLWWRVLCPWCWLTIKTTGLIQGCSYAKRAFKCSTVWPLISKSN